MTMKSREGIDASNNNAHPPADFPALGFCIAKASEGLTFIDSTFNRWSSLALLYGQVLGAYHFAHPDANNPIAEADYFLSRRGSAKVLAVDIESRAGHDPLSILGAANLANWINQFCGRVKAITAATPFVYCNRSYLTALSKFLGPWPIWLATLDGHAHYPTYAGRSIAIEQYAIVAGVDRNVAYVDLDTSIPTPTPPTPLPPQEDDDMLFLIQGDKPEWYLTAVTKPVHITGPDDFAKLHIAANAAHAAGDQIANVNNGPIRLSQAQVDAFLNA